MNFTNRLIFIGVVLGMIEECLIVALEEHGYELTHEVGLNKQNGFKVDFFISSNDEALPEDKQEKIITAGLDFKNDLKWVVFETTFCSLSTLEEITSEWDELYLKGTWRDKEYYNPLFKKIENFVMNSVKELKKYEQR